MFLCKLGKSTQNLSTVLVDLQAVVAIFPRKVTGGRIVSILVETVTTPGCCSSKNLELRWEADTMLTGFGGKKPRNRWGKKEEECGERGSNTRPSDLQSDALPTELSPPSCSFIL
ncbi:hypothetical protein NC653_030234 [Populus alba x Populus x berolinensis]|uniref:Uncharacterized protein n=1 Tax=Populus alba x Populus x berolinensis TaxID=444605 RepID=A0AAD6LWP1_9ROSI|nr:hypothetical protein NC653_030234 [Populus alba x Populus x berolinensis]